MIGFKTIEEFTLAECNAYLVRTDISEADRQRALNQRNYLIGQMPPTPKTPTLSQTPPQPKTIIEMFPEYGFKPTSLLPGPATKGKSYARVPILIGYFLLLAGLVCLGLMTYYYSEESKYRGLEEFYKEIADRYSEEGDNESSYEASRTQYEMERKKIDMNELAEYIMLPIGVPLTCVGVIVLLIAYSCRRQTPIKAVADYVSTTGKGVNKGRPIFVKSRMFGVLKHGSSQVIVPAEYDKLTWATGKFLFGEINGKTLLVDTKGNRCTKPYDRLTWSEHEGVLRAEQGGRRFLIDVYDNELS